MNRFHPRGPEGGVEVKPCGLEVRCRTAGRLGDSAHGCGPAWSTVVSVVCLGSVTTNKPMTGGSRLRLERVRITVPGSLRSQELLDVRQPDGRRLRVGVPATLRELRISKNLFCT